MFVMEGMLVGAIGGALGLAFGSGLTTLINHVNIQMPPPPGYTEGYLLRIALSPSLLMNAFEVSLITATLAAIIPSIRGSRLNIVRALAHN
jgi:putative ABC transport system permease protein